MIDSSLTLFQWAGFRQTMAGIMAQNRIDSGGGRPTCIDINGARRHDVGWTDRFYFESGASYLVDRGCVNAARPILIVNARGYLVTYAKYKFRFNRHC